MKKMLVFLILALLVPVADMAVQVGKITGLKGTVQFRAKNNIPYGKLAKGAVISEGNWIKTGPNGWVELTLSDRSRFTLANNTTFEVTSFMVGKNRRKGSFNLAQGRLRASIVKFGGTQSGLTVRSGTAVAGIKGTEFMMLTEGQANVFFCNEGTVG